MERVLRNSSGRAVILLAAIVAMAIVGIKVVLVNSNDYMSFKNGLSSMYNASTKTNVSLGADNGIVLSNKTYVLVVGSIAEKIRTEDLERYTRNYDLVSNIAMVSTVISRSYEDMSVERLVIAGYAGDIKAVLLDSRVSGELQRALQNGVDVEVVILHGSRDDRWVAIGAWLKLLGSMGVSRAIVLIDPSSARDVKTDRLKDVPVDRRIYEAEGIALSLVNTSSGVGTGVFVIQDTGSIERSIAIAAKTFEETPYPAAYRAALEMGKALLGSSAGASFLGYVGWKCATGAGEQWVRMEYYYVEARSGGIRYRFYLAYSVHWQRYYASPDTPLVFVSGADWMTHTFSGQVLWDWSPKNGGCINTAATPHYAGETRASTEAGHPVQPSRALCYFDVSDPGDGVAAARYELRGTGIPPPWEYSVELWSIGHLDPIKPGGDLPMVVRHYFEGPCGTITYTVALYEPTHTALDREAPG